MLRVLLTTAAVVAVAATGVALAAGNPAAGKKVYLANGCGACHTFKPARSKGKVGLRSPRRDSEPTPSAPGSR